MPTAGRPTNDQKTLYRRFRLSEKDNERLEYCAKVTGQSKSEIIRQGIQELYNRLKK